MWSQTLGSALNSLRLRAPRALQRLRNARPLRRTVALTLVYLLLHSQGVMLSSALHGETAGATAPEVTKFEPVDTTDLVNLATGDFNYTIPIINVPGPEGGYPLALSYHAGIQHGEEASWVGLGWNLQPGSIARSVRGYPDDFNGESITTNYRSNVYETASVGVQFMFVEAGVSYQTYNGWSGYVGITAAVGYNMGYANAEAGASLRATFAEGGKTGIVGTLYASVGVGPVSYSLSASTDFQHGMQVSDSIGVSISASGYDHGTGGYNSISGALAGKVNNSISSASSSFSSYSGGGQHSVTIGVGVRLGIIGGTMSFTRSWIDDNQTEIAHGYYYHTAPLTNNTEIDPLRVNEWTMESDPGVVPGDNKEHALASGLHYLPSYDGYSFTGQGTGGSIKPTRLEDRVFRPKKLKDEWWEGSAWPWAGNPPAVQFVVEGDNSESINQPNSIGNVIDNITPSPEYAAFKALVTDPNMGQLTHSTFDNHGELYIGKSIGSGSRRVQPTLVNGKFDQFDIWEADGKRYKYGVPIRNLWSENINANVNKISDDVKRLRTNWWAYAFFGVFGLIATTHQTGHGDQWFRSVTNTNTPYAYAWYLSELTYPDYLDTDNNGVSVGDRGGWVKFNYVMTNGDYHWSSSSDGEFNDGPINRIDKLGKKKAGMMYSMMHGSKELKYLNLIETATHSAYFVTSPRLDAREIYGGGTPAISRSVSIAVDPADASVYKMTTQRPSELGLTVPPAGDPRWVETTHTFSPSACLDNQDEHIVYTYVMESDSSIVIKGVPIKVKQGDVIVYYSDIIFREGAHTPDEPPTCERITSNRYEIPMKPANQFWDQSISGVSSAFPEINNAWNTIKNANTIITTSSMMKLDDIYLIERATGKLVKQVHFKYEYLLAKGTPNSVDEQVLDSLGNLQRPNPNKAKLTLVSVQTYGTGGTTDVQSMLPPYQFKYNEKPDWGTKYSYDRWGFHKSDGGPWRHRDVNGEDQSAWSLTKITLPSGGTLQIQYEPKDYARVQDRVPLNPRANQRTISNYLVDLAPWVTANPWPSTNEDWGGFRNRLRSIPFYLYPPRGRVADGLVINPVHSSLNHIANNHIPIQSAPNPKDLKLWLVRKSQAYLQNLAIADNLAGIGSIERNPQNNNTPDVVIPKGPQQALDAEVTEPLTVERMVNINFEYWTAGMRGQKRMTRPLKVLEPADIGSEGDDDRTDVITRSAVVRMRSTSDGGVNMYVTDPDFEWPKEAPNAMYVTWTANPKTPKLGGGVRVKRILSNDGLRSFTTAYVYTDFVNGEWTTSGVAAQEPPPFGFSADDDRVIQTEKGGWANEGGGGIYHSRVVVRHGWSEDPTPAGVAPAPGTPAVETPLGETVFRFISPSDLPHRVKDVDYAWNRASTNANGEAVNTTNSARITEIFNVGAWWGRLLWKEDRDRFGKVLGRVENYYTQLEGYLRIFPVSEAGRAGYDVDVEHAWNSQRQQNTSYTWAESSRTPGSENLPTLVKKEGLNPAAVGKDFPTSSPGYLNTSVNITVMQSSVNRRRFTRYKNLSNWKDLNGGEPIDIDEVTGESELGWHSSIRAVREVNLAPIVREVRTYGEGLKLLGVTRNTKWDARTGAVMETETRGRKSAGGDEWVINRSWPAYWVYQGMEDKNMLSQGALTTTLRRIPGQPADAYLNSKATTWWKPTVGTSAEAWMKGGEFVWNGLGSVPTPPSGLFPNWNPDQIDSLGIQPYKSSNWLLAGAVTKYDAYAHALEAVDGDGVYGCSKYGYPYGSSGDPTVANPLPARILPVAKFANARYDETTYLNFEGHENGPTKFGTSAAPVTDDPLQKLAAAYSGERAFNLQAGSLSVNLPGTAAEMEFRFFVKAASAAQAKAVYPIASEVLSVTQAEGEWWFVRAKAIRSAGSNRTFTSTGLVDDVAVFPWRNNGAPVSVSHYAYDRALGLVTSITGSNGRTARYQYDSLGRLKKVFDVYGKPTSSTRYRHVAAN